MDRGACWETASHSATQEFPLLSVAQNSLPCLHDSVLVRIYWTILIHSTILCLISLIRILIRHYSSIEMVFFAGVLIDNLHKTSIICFIVSRVCFVASVLFTILMNGKVWKLSVWLEFITRGRRSDAVITFGQSVPTDAWRIKRM
jgi:hypothetical protein